MRFLEALSSGAGRHHERDELDTMRYAGSSGLGGSPYLTPQALAQMRADVVMGDSSRNVVFDDVSAMSNAVRSRTLRQGDSVDVVGSGEQVRGDVDLLESNSLNVNAPLSQASLNDLAMPLTSSASVSGARVGAMTKSDLLRQAGSLGTGGSPHYLQPQLLALMRGGDVLGDTNFQYDLTDVFRTRVSGHGEFVDVGVGGKQMMRDGDISELDSQEVNAPMSQASLNDLAMSSPYVFVFGTRVGATNKNNLLLQSGKGGGSGGVGGSRNLKSQFDISQSGLLDASTSHLATS